MNRLLAVLLVAAALLAPAASAAPLEVSECRVAAPANVVCRGELSAAGVTHPFDARSDLVPPDPLRAKSLVDPRCHYASAFGFCLVPNAINASLEEQVALGPEGTYTTAATARLNTAYASRSVPGISLNVYPPWFKCYEDREPANGLYQMVQYPCFQGIPVPVQRWCYSASMPNYDECGGYAINVAYYCGGTVVRLGTVPPALGHSVPLAFCVDPAFHQRLLGGSVRPPSAGVDPSALLAFAQSPPPAFASSGSADDGLVHYELRPYGTAPGTGCYGHRSPTGLLGTQEVCLR